MFERLKETHQLIKQNRPIVLNLTNHVTMDLVANSLLALGASPIMSEDKRELEELISISGAINFNIGTLTENFLENGRIAVQYAHIYNKPIVLDPVGAGASLIRTKAALEFLPKSSIIRGNASEIISLENKELKTQGVDSTKSSHEAINIAQTISKKNKCTVVISGAEDKIINSKNICSLPYGSFLMSRITGMGCSLTSIIAAFHAVCPDPFEASILATSYFGLCGEQAKSKAPGSFRTAFIDALYEPDYDMMKSRLLSSQTTFKN